MLRAYNYKGSIVGQAKSSLTVPGFKEIPPPPPPLPLPVKRRLQMALFVLTKRIMERHSTSQVLFLLVYFFIRVEYC